MDALRRLTADAGITVCIDAPVGTWLVPGDAIGWVVNDDGTPVDERTKRDISEMLSLEPSRDPVVDVGFGIRVMVDIALMAISPAINDPYTAVQCIDELAGVFAAIDDLHLGPFTWTAPDGIQRVRIGAATPGDLLDQAITPLLPYAGGDDTVLRSLGHLARVGQRTMTSDEDRRTAERLGAEVAVSGDGGAPTT